MLNAGQSDSIASLLRHIEDSWPVNRWGRSNVVVAVSGGADSTALLRLLAALKQTHGGSGELIALYCHHQTRKSCDAEQGFVMQLAKKLSCRFHCETMELGSRSDKVDTALPSEDSLRQFRYEAFMTTAKKFAARYVATAHHSDDQIETVLFRLFRGTGIHGLAGIPAIRVDRDVTLVRPLLDTSKAELLQALGDWDQEYCLDESNGNEKYARNFIRNQVMPLIKQRFERTAEASILRVAAQARQMEQLLESLAAPILQDVQHPKQGQRTAKIAVDQLVAQPAAVVIYVAGSLWRQSKLPLKEMTQTKWDQIREMIVNGDDCRLQLPGKVTAVVDAKQFWLEATPPFQRRSDRS